MSEFTRGDRVVLTAEAQRSFPAMVTKGSHVGEVLGVKSSRRLCIKRDGVKNADYWGAGLWQRDRALKGNDDARESRERIAELERHQAEAAKAILDLRSALTAAAVEIHFQHRIGISSMIECPEARCREWCALLDRTSSDAIQRAREHTT